MSPVGVVRSPQPRFSFARRITRRSSATGEFTGGLSRSLPWSNSAPGASMGLTGQTSWRAHPTADFSADVGAPSVPRCKGSAHKSPHLMTSWPHQTSWALC